MAECSLARCSQERRVFRKEFQRWSRDVLFVVGLERVAEELVGPKKWKKLTELESAIEQELEVTDWEPDEVCYFCNSKRMLPYDPAGGFLPEGYSSFKSFKVDIDEQSTCSDHGNGSVSSNACQGADAYLEPTSPSVSDDQPLDLSLHSHKHHPPEIDESLDGVDPLLKVPNLPCKIGKRRGDPLNCKRSYTEEELQAALRDIQSGKLGTRRAAVIYGIPRSTLRNKVYKLALERRAGRKVATASSPSKDSVVFSNGTVDGSCNSKTGTPSASESLRQLLKSTITQKNQGKLVDKDPATELGSSSSNSDAMNTLQLLSSPEYNQSLAPLFAQFLSSIQQLALNPNKESSVLPNNTPPPDVKLPVMSDLIKLLAGERLEQECSRQRDQQQASPANQTSESPSNVILKIPSYKPVTSNCAPPSSATPANPSDAGKSGVTLSLKELIARSINQRVGNSAVATSTTSTAAVTTTSSNSSTSSEKTMAQANGNSSSSPQQSTPALSKPDQQSEKRTRPKRGRYRNYDRDNLLQAVRAVQRGEMSVHRAGTYFGVPHSTLEYKVKERHLLRPKKRGTAANAAKGYHHFKLDGLSADESTKVAGLQNGTKTADGTCPPWQALPFLSMDLTKLGSGFFASQVMRKLQTTTYEAEKKGAEGGGGAGILEALITSTLERSTPSDGAKAGEPPALVKN